MYILSAAAPIIAALIIAFTTIYVAKRLYPRQKKEDRRIEIKKMQLELYQSYLKTLTDDLGFHADRTNEKERVIGVDEIGIEQRFKVTRFRAAASIYASEEALEQMRIIAEKREPGNPLEMYANEIVKFAFITRNECLADEGLVNRLTADQIRKYLPFDLPATPWAKEDKGERPEV